MWVSQGMLLVRVTFEMTVTVDLFTRDEKMEIGEWDYCLIRWNYSTEQAQKAWGRLSGEKEGNRQQPGCESPFIHA